MTLDLERSLSSLSHADDLDPGAGTIRAQAVARRQRRSRRLATVGVAGLVLVVLAAVAVVRLGTDDPETHVAPRLPDVRVEHLQASGTAGLVRTIGRDFGFDVGAIVRLGDADGAPLVAASRNPDGEVPAAWSDDDGQTWLPIQVAGGSSAGRASTSVAVIDDLVVLTSTPSASAPPGSTTALWSGTDLATPLEQAQVEFALPSGSSHPLLVTAAPATRIDGDYVLFGLADDEPVRLRSRDGSRWIVEPMAVPEGGGFPPSPDLRMDPLPVEEVIAGAGPLATSTWPDGPLVSVDGGRSWAPAELPDRDPIDGLGHLHEVDGVRYLATWQHAWRSDDGRTWTTLFDRPLEGARFGLGSGLVVLAGEGDQLTGRIGAQDGETSYRADLGWSLDGGRTWRASSGVPPCPPVAYETRGGVTEAAALGDGSLLVTWWCENEMRVLRTTDLGRSWTTVPGSVTSGRWSAPIATADGAVVLVGTAGSEQPSAPYLRIELAP
jgi:hypothetical protein